jgi:cytochrome c553
MIRKPGPVSIVTSIEFLVSPSQHPPTRIRTTKIAARWIRQDMNRKILDKPFPFLMCASCHKRKGESGSQRIPPSSRCQRLIEDDGY